MSEAEKPKRRVRKNTTLPKHATPSTDFKGKRLTPAELSASGMLDRLLSNPEPETFAQESESNVSRGTQGVKEFEGANFDSLQQQLYENRQAMESLAVRIRGGLTEEQFKQSKFEHAVLADKEKSIRRDLQMFHKAALNGMGVVRAVRIIREDFTGIGERKQELQLT